MISLIELTSRNFGLFQTQVLAIERCSFPSPWSLKAFQEEIERPISRLWAATEEEVLSGYNCFWLVSDEIHLMNLAVHPAKRGRGLGALLLAKMLEEGSNQAVHTAWLEVRPSNVIAQRMYLRAGFRETGRRKKYYNDTGEDAIVMALRPLKRHRSGGF
jgi:ribosomal-protein-alanine N-acetyltransferase